MKYLIIKVCLVFGIVSARKSMLDFVFEIFPSLLPNNGPENTGRHAIDPGHLVSKDFKQEFKDIVEENGFKFDKYEVVTDDGYILTLFRIRS